ncbi:hypothetical protein P154DRAFT_258632 [Amniculicola lignicola CBS 123094]|uniref:Uncharacterized protein n=1 Tax=Amniculicola lignicola CBS 123094 TaxID=1392246 RepID=A0A6A5WZ02_9PLEO|nr:hypothetical protein P154DRAFT_258632 [Amniculicola lignicola CBS 123094]
MGPRTALQLGGSLLEDRTRRRGGRDWQGAGSSVKIFAAAGEALAGVWGVAGAKTYPVNGLRKQRAAVGRRARAASSKAGVGAAWEQRAGGWAGTIAVKCVDVVLSCRGSRLICRQRVSECSPLFLAAVEEQEETSEQAGWDGLFQNSLPDESTGLRIVITARFDGGIMKMRSAGLTSGGPGDGGFCARLRGGGVGLLASTVLLDNLKQANAKGCEGPACLRAGRRR